MDIQSNYSMKNTKLLKPEVVIEKKIGWLLSSAIVPESHRRRSNEPLAALEPQIVELWITVSDHFQVVAEMLSLTHMFCLLAKLDMVYSFKILYYNPFHNSVLDKMCDISSTKLA